MQTSPQSNDKIYDLAVIGGGINGVGIAADASGRGLSVFLCEKMIWPAIHLLQVVS